MNETTINISIRDRAGVLVKEKNSETVREIFSSEAKDKKDERDSGKIHNKIVRQV